MGRGLIVALCLALAGCGLSNQQLRVAYHAANVADAGTTMYGMDHGCEEGNPLLGSHPNDATVAAVAVGSALLYEWVCGNADESERACRVMFLGAKLLFAGANTYTISQECN